MSGQWCLCLVCSRSVKRRPPPAKHLKGLQMSKREGSSVKIKPSKKKKRKAREGSERWGVRTYAYIRIYIYI